MSVCCRDDPFNSEVLPGETPALLDCLPTEDHEEINDEWVTLTSHVAPAFHTKLQTETANRNCVTVLYTLEICYSALRYSAGSNITRVGHGSCSYFYQNVHKQSNIHIFVQLFWIIMPPPFEEWWRGIKCYPCPCVCACVRPLSKFGVRSITFERLHRFNSNLVCWYILSKHRSSSIWVTIHLLLTELWAFYKNIVHKNIVQKLVSAQ